MPILSNVTRPGDKAKVWDWGGSRSCVEARHDASLILSWAFRLEPDVEHHNDRIKCKINYNIGSVFDDQTSKQRG